MNDLPVNWPRFEVVTYAQPTGIPHGWDGELVALGVPKRTLGRYEALDELKLIEHPVLGPLVCFASLKRGSMGLHPETGSIHWLTGLRSGREWFANSSLAQFNDAVRAVMRRFPFEQVTWREWTDAPEDDPSILWQAYQAHRSEDVDWATIGEQTRAMLRRLDPESVANPDGYWNTFVTELAMGDYSIESVVTLPKAQRVIIPPGSKRIQARDK